MGFRPVHRVPQPGHQLSCDGWRCFCRHSLRQLLRRRRPRSCPGMSSMYLLPSMGRSTPPTKAALSHCPPLVASIGDRGCGYRLNQIAGSVAHLWEKAAYLYTATYIQHGYSGARPGHQSAGTFSGSRPASRFLSPTTPRRIASLVATFCFHGPPMALWADFSGIFVVCFY